MRLLPVHAFGVGPCPSFDVLGFPDDNGSSKEHIVHVVGQHIALLRIEDGEIKFLSCPHAEIRQIITLSLAPNSKQVAVSESQGQDKMRGSDSFMISMRDGCQNQDLNTQLNARHIDVPSHGSISVYNIISGSRLKRLSLPSCSRCIMLAWSSDCKRLATIVNRYTEAGAERLEERPLLSIWQWENEKIETSLSLTTACVSELTIFTHIDGKEFASTSGQRHLKIWLLTENGLKMHPILPSAQEKSGNFVDHQWKQQHKSAIGQLDRGRNLNAGSQLLVIARTKCDRIANIHDATFAAADTNERKHDNLSIAEACEDSILLFEVTGTAPYLEHKHTIEVPNIKGQLETLAAYERGFCVAGTLGLFAVYGCQDDPTGPYVLQLCCNIQKLSCGANNPSWFKLAISTNGETVLARAKDSSLYSYHLKNVDSSTTEHDLGKHFEALSKGGVAHDGAILSMDLSVHRPLIATCGKDRTIRIWNYMRKRCELLHRGGPIWSGDVPSCVSIHPYGFQLIVGYPERVRVFSLLFEALKLLHDFPLAKCRHVKYAHGGHQFACASGVRVVIYSAISMAHMYSIDSHSSPLRCIVWAEDDLSLYSPGTDGQIYAWNLANRTHIEEIARLNESSQFCAIAVRVPTRGGQHAAGPETSNGHIVGASFGGGLKELTWMSGAAEQTRTRELCAGVQTQDVSNQTILTVLAVLSCEKLLFAGTTNGGIRAYAWPVEATVDGALTSLTEVPTHGGPIIAMQAMQMANDSMLFSAAVDGIVFVFAIENRRPNSLLGEAKLSVNCSDPSTFQPLLSYADDVVQIRLEELESGVSTVVELRKKLEDQRSKSDFALHRKNLEWEAELKRTRDDCNVKLTIERKRLQQSQDVHDSTVGEHRKALARRGSHHVQVTHELENQYEHKLALEMERYDRLSEEIEVIQQRCEGLLQAQAVEHEAAIRVADENTKRAERELHQQIERLHEDAKHNELMFREVLDQQEHEYETELQQLMAAAQAELTAERENTAEARGLVQTRNTKISRLEKRMDELKTSSHARNVLLTAEKVRNAKLEATLRHFKRHMEERESTLEDKELSILNLRRKNVTLDNFRFVLDHRVEQLMEERGPITHHVGGLEAHISAMYDELEAEYYEKKKKSQQLDSKEMKIHTLGQEAVALQGLLRKREAYIASFKRELSTLVGLTTPKDLEDAIKHAYHKFVKDEVPRHMTKKTGRALIDNLSDDINNTSDFPSSKNFVAGATKSQQAHVDLSPEVKARLVNVSELKDALLEAHSQRACVQRAAGNLKHRLDIVKADSQRSEQMKSGENSHLIAECNLLRRENLSLSREVNHLRQLVKDHTAATAKRREKSLSHKKFQFQINHGSNQPTETTNPTSPKPSPSLSTFLASGDVLEMHACAHEAPDCMPRYQGIRYRGSTRTLNQLSLQDAKIIEMASQLDVNLRIIETHKMQIKALKTELHGIRISQGKNSRELQSSGCYDASSGTHVHLGVLPIGPD